jgi:hypothetical protein
VSYLLVKNDVLLNGPSSLHCRPRVAAFDVGLKVWFVGCISTEPFCDSAGMAGHDIGT